MPTDSRTSAGYPLSKLDPTAPVPCGLDTDMDADDVERVLDAMIDE